MNKKFAGERLETDIFDGNTINHLHRYALVNNYIKNKIVLDIASGEGYGSNLVSEYAEYVYGVDIDDETIQKAQKKYKKTNLEFILGSAASIPLEDNSVNVVVSFETIEHHNQHNQMLEEVKRVLKPDGLFIVSTPDKHFYSDLRNYNNPFHVKELYKSEFESLINNHFKNYQLLSQSYLNGNSVVLDHKNRKEIEFYKGNFIEVKNTISNPHFLIAICSDINFEKQHISIFEGCMFVKSSLEYEALVKEIYNSNSYKLGHALLFVFKYLKRAMKKFFK